MVSAATTQRVSCNVGGKLGALASVLILGLLACSSEVAKVDERPGQPDAAVEPAVDLAVRPFDIALPPPDLTVGPDLGGKPPGASCTGDKECISGVCKPVGSGGGSICVAPCRMQSDCAALPGGLFCEPKTAGSTDGYCIPPSPTHCASCSADSDCGVLAERCSLAPGDIAPACHIDCALSAAACPTDYACTSVDEPGPTPGSMVSRKLCLPKTRVCLDALGGYCDRVSLPQDCARQNDAGSCLGQRTCLPGGRYDKCGATAPQYKRCTDMDPPGCMLKLAPDATTNRLNCGMCGRACAADEDCCSSVCKKLTTATDCGSCGKSCAAGSGCCGGSCTALNTVQNCGGCGQSCPGQGLTTNEVFCDPASRTCGMTCRGDNYDVDSNPGNGCDVLRATIGPDPDTSSVMAAAFRALYCMVKSLTWVVVERLPLNCCRCHQGAGTKAYAKRDHDAAYPNQHKPACRKPSWAIPERFELRSRGARRGPGHDLGGPVAALTYST